MIIKPNTSPVDVALNLSGSLSGLPLLLDQLPVGKRVGFDDMPEQWQEVADIGQTWTPDLVGLDLDVSLPVLNPQAQEKQPYTTNLHLVGKAADFGNKYVYVPPPPLPLSLGNVPHGYNLRGKLITITRTDLPIQFALPFGAAIIVGVKDTNPNNYTYVYPPDRIHRSIYIGMTNNANPNTVYMRMEYANSTTSGSYLYFIQNRNFVMSQLTYRYPNDRDIFVENSFNQDAPIFPEGTWSWFYALITD